MKTTVRDSKSPSKGNSSKQPTLPTSPVAGHGSYLSNQDFLRYNGRGAGTVNFLQKNRQACSRMASYAAANTNPAAGSSPPRGKIGQAPMIGDALGTPSNKGSSSFMSAGHNGVRDLHLRGIFKKRDTSF